MRESLLELLRCPRCEGTGLSLESPVQDAREVRSATLACACGARHPVTDGIPALTVPGRELEQARAHAFADAAAESGLITNEAELLDYEQMHRRLDPRESGRFCYGLVENWDLALARMEPLAGAVVLDVGAGVTWTTRRLAERGARAVAVDLVRERWAGLASADSYLRVSTAFWERVEAAMDRLPFRDGCFDRVLFHAALHHAEPLEVPLREAYRVLRPGGVVHLVNEPAGSLLGLFDGRFTAGMAAAGEHIYTLRDYRRALRRAGFVPRILFAPGTAARIDALAAGGRLPPPGRPGQAIKYALARAGLGLWRRWPGLRRLFERRLYFAWLAVFGQFLVAEGRRGGSGPHLAGAGEEGRASGSSARGRPST